MAKHSKTHYIPDEVFDPVIEEPKVGKWEHFTPDFVGTQTQVLNTQTMDLQMAEFRKVFNDIRIGQNGGEAHIRTEYPIQIYFLGDVHFGSVFCEYERFYRDLETIKSTPGAYICFLGNEIDNAIPAKYPSNMLNNSIPPDQQVVRMRMIMQDLNSKGKILGVVQNPCHEGWTWAQTGQDINAMIFGFEGRKFPVLDNGSILKVEVGEVTYNVVLYHQVGPFESNFNETHALRQMNRLNLMMQGDVVVGGHKHVGSVQLSWEGTSLSGYKQVAYVRSGCYKGVGKTPDQWAVMRYGASGEPSGQSVILWANERRIAVANDIETGQLLYQSALASTR